MITYRVELDSVEWDELFGTEVKSEDVKRVEARDAGDAAIKAIKSFHGSNGIMSLNVTVEKD